jgi:site-specific DNA-methyltransferase (adenine-specific)
MTHLSENKKELSANWFFAKEETALCDYLKEFNDVCVLVLPPRNQNTRGQRFDAIEKVIATVASQLGSEATLVTIGEVVDLVHAHTKLSGTMQYQLWISIKRASLQSVEDKTALPEHHFGALVHTKYKGSLRHTITRIKYTYCPVCDKTTKDYGGKKHTYNPYGTLISDVWRDLSANLEGNLNHVIERLSDLLGVEPYLELRVIDCRAWEQSEYVRNWETGDRATIPYNAQRAFPSLVPAPHQEQGQLLLGDSLEKLRQLPDNSVDFAFADPPYNLKKKYNDYSDDLSIAEYFEWCDEWLTELARVLRPGRTCAVLNIPLWSIRHFLHLETVLTFQNWITWDALSFPVRMIMPAHYTILCFSKGRPRPLPGLMTDTPELFPFSNGSPAFSPLEPMAEDFCLRSNCLKARKLQQTSDRATLTDLWWDIHRLKHNSRRVDHPCQLPPQLLYRLISIFTEQGEIVLDCFNGAGTTTLAAHQLGRRYIGIELSEKYHRITELRHEEVRLGVDPFRKVERELTEKNSPVARMPKQNYEVSKKTLQLEVRRVARELNRLPTRQEMVEYGKYPIKFYDEYFASWGEVCAAARHDGMSERRQESDVKIAHVVRQLSLFSAEEAETLESPIAN